MNDDQIDGTITEATGRVKDAFGGLTGDTGTQAEGKIDEVTGQAQQALGDARETVSSVAGKTAETLRETAETVKAKASAVGGKVYEAGATAGSYVGSTIQQQPVLSLIGMAAIGYLVGYLLHAPSSPLNPEPRYRRVLNRWS
jgi:uncharacterized protein YjbJ (UPF0337 family)